MMLKEQPKLKEPQVVKMFRLRLQKVKENPWPSTMKGKGDSQKKIYEVRNKKKYISTLKAKVCL